MVDASYMADEVADAFGGPSFATLMTLLVLILVVFVASTSAPPRPPPPSRRSPRRRTSCVRQPAANICPGAH